MRPDRMKSASVALTIVFTDTGKATYRTRLLIRVS